MLSYRHDFHAGNLADVLKHTVLTGVLTAAIRKPKPLLFVDTHAGAGAYDLESARARGEHASGIGRVLALRGAGTALPGGVLDYLASVDAARASRPNAYPGSVAIAAHLLRPVDRIVAAELHPADARDLRRRFARDRNVQVVEGDGYALLRSRLPPPEGRGVVLIDPAYELGDEAGRVAAGLEDALTRFGHGTYLVWYPRRGKLDHRRFVQRLLRAADRHGRAAPVKVLRVELGGPSDDAGAIPSGMLLINPPWSALVGLEAAHRWLVEHLGRGEGTWAWESRGRTPPGAPPV